MRNRSKAIACLMMGAVWALASVPREVDGFVLLTNADAAGIAGGACVQRGFPLNCGEDPEAGAACVFASGFAKMIEDRVDGVNFFKHWCSNPGPLPDDESEYPAWEEAQQACGHTHTECALPPPPQG